MLSNNPRSKTLSASNVEKPFQIPDTFGIVEPGVYRCSLPNANHYLFLETLHLKCIVFLSQEVVEKSFINFCAKHNIQFFNLGTSFVQYPSSYADTNQRSIRSPESYSSIQNSVTSFDQNQNKQPYQMFDHVPVAAISSSWKHCSEELIKETLELVLCKNNHPIMIMCSSGVHLTGTVVGCLRRLQSWSLTAILEEYESFAQKKSRHANREFIELFDIDLISLPVTSQLPDWFVFQREMMVQEKRYANSNNKIAFKSSNVPEITKDDRRLAFLEYWFCRDAPLISAKSSFTKHSVIEEEDD
jgi:hypothetical protein